MGQKIWDRVDSDQKISDRIGFLKQANYLIVSTQSDPMHISIGISDHQIMYGTRFL